MRARSRRHVGVVSALCMVLLSVGLGSVTAAAPDPSQVGSWSGEIPLGIIGIHAALLPSGNVLFYELPGSTLARARIFNPTTHVVTAVDPHLSWSVFCSGMSLLPDGRLLATGGEPPRTAQHPVGTGTANAAIFDPATKVWSAAAPMANPRWYPSDVEMPNGTILVMGGETVPAATDKMVKPMESYVPATNKWTTLPPSADVTGLYPRSILMPSGDVVKAGPQRPTRVYDPATKTWSTVANMIYGPRTAGGVVLLPGLHTILTSGGESGTAVTNTAELLDMSAASPHWVATGSMAIARMHHNLVLLPDGTVLAVGGGQQGNFGAPVKTAELYNPATGTWKTMATQAGQRTYHSTALLLPDGRVISAGSNSGKPEQTTVEIYSPPYLFHGARPTVTSAPGAVAYGSTFDVATPDAAGITRVALLQDMATTHGWAQDQRYVNLTFTKGNGVLHVTAPPNAATAPPASYLLFLVNAAGVPSVAKIISVP
jgi:WD40 repeat protein